MAIDAKVSFLGQVERKCADLLTVSTMEKTMQIISDILEGFDMRECERWEEIQKDDLLDSYISSMRVSGRSEKTIHRYEYMIGRFMKYTNVPTRKINVYHIRNWLASEKDRGVQDSTLEGHRQILSAYFGWLFREALIERNPMVNVGPIKVPKKQKKIVTDIEMEKLKQACERLPGIKRYRNRAIIAFLASTGCRVSEMTGLDRDSVDLKSMEVVVHGKGDKERVVYLDAVAVMLLQQYLSKRKDNGVALFVGKEGRRLEPGGVRAMLNALANSVGVEHIHPHKFRRTLATEMTRHGMPIQEVANILGHEKLDTTMSYVVLDHDTVKANYRKFA